MTFDDSKPNNPPPAHDDHSSCCDETCSDQEPCSSAEHLEEAAKPEVTPAANPWDPKINCEPCGTSDKCGSANGQCGPSAETICDEEPDLAAELKKAQKKIAELTDYTLRLRADMDNQRKIHERELDKAYKFSIDKLVRDLVPIKDSLDIGVGTGKANPANGEAILEGLILIQKMLGDVLAKNKVEQIFPLGEKFNPELHEALSMLHSEEYEQDMIMNVFQSGFILNGRPIRPARVIVSRGAPMLEPVEPKDK